MSLGIQCIVGLIVGGVLGAIGGSWVTWLAPVGEAFIRAAQIVTMPYMILELIVSLGNLSERSRRVLVRTGGIAFVCVMCCAVVMAALVPSWLPALETSAFFRPDMLVDTARTDLVSTYLPFNVFGAMAADNFPAVVLFCAVLGFVVQSLESKDVILRPADVLRRVFQRMNKLVAKLTPLGVLAFTAVSIAALDMQQLIRLHALPVLGIGGYVVLVVAIVVLIVSFTPVSIRQLWRMMSAPFVVTLSTTNLIIALPMLVESITRELGGDEATDEQIAAVIPVGFILPTVGQVFMLFMVPFCAWYADRTFTTMSYLQLFATGIPSVVGGIRSTVRLELANAGLPEDLISVFFLNGEWIYRIEKTLAMLGMVAMVLAVVAHSRGALMLRIRPAIIGLVVTVALTLGLGVGTRAMLEQTLEGTYNGAATMMTLAPMIPPAPVIQSDSIPPYCGQMFLPYADTVSLHEIRTRGVLRVGVRVESVPWAYRRADGQLVGYDVDVATALARRLGVRVVFYEAPIATLEQWIASKRVDIALGGILDSPTRSAMYNSTDEYQKVHRALVVHDDHVSVVQDRTSRKPLRIATADTEPVSEDVQRALARELGTDEQPAVLTIVRIGQHADFLRDTTHRIADALLTTAEGGATWSVVYPRTSMMAVLGNTMPASCVMLVAGNDSDLCDYVHQWVVEERMQSMFDRLFTYWIAR